MSEQDKARNEANHNISIESEENANNYLFDIFFKVFGLLILLATIVMLVSYIMSLYYNYPVLQIVCEEQILNLFYFGCSIQIGNYLYLRTLGYLLLLNVAFMPVITRKQDKLYRYILYFVSMLCLLIPFFQLLVTTDAILKTDSYFLLETIFISTSLFMVFADIFIKKSKLYDNSSLFTFMVMIFSAITQ
ncbi:MAG: hypothetical protein AAF383_20920 [Cyanobacteria bacterium P01_A01_bin.83]